MRIDRLHLADFRSHRDVDITLAPGLTAVLGGNGRGKTNLLEAIAFTSRLGSFRGAPTDALVRVGADRAIVRAELSGEERHSLFEAEIPRTGRQRVQLNRQRVTRRAELLAVYQVTVFAPDDLALIKAGPQGRRNYLDDLLAALHPRHDALRSEVERIVRQRNALLKQAAGNPRPPADVMTTLDVWDQKLAQTGEALADARDDLVGALDPHIQAAYAQVAERSADVAASYHRSWTGPLSGALGSSRSDDLRRGVTTVGPHHDDLLISLAALPSRTHASQGEQRSLALAMRLAGHRVVTGTIGSAPVLLLDDVFSELDPDRAEALLGSLPEGQTLLTTAGTLPARAQPARVLRVEEGKVLP